MLLSFLQISVVNGQDITPQIKWEVIDRFPLLRKSDEFFKILQFTENQSLEDWAGKILANNQRMLKRVYGDRLYCTQNRVNNDFPTMWNPCTKKYDPELFAKPTKHKVKITLSPPPDGTCEYKIGRLSQPSSYRTEIKKCSDSFIETIKYGDGPTEIIVDIKSLNKQFSENIEVKDILLFAFGDSFSSGESNPDIPLKHLDKPLMDIGENPYDGIKWLKQPHDFQNANQSRWLDRTCHRSLYSWPILAAAKLAVDHPHLVVRIASWACTGAEIPDGFFSAQGNDVQESQFSAARKAICINPDGNGSQFNAIEWRKDKITEWRKDKITSKDKTAHRVELKGCANPSDRIRNIDAILFTFGGNDVFFGRVILGAIAKDHLQKAFSRLDPIYTAMKKKYARTPEQANARIKNPKIEDLDSLGTRYLSLAKAFESLGVSTDHVVQVQYPNPLHKTNGELCYSSEHDDMGMLTDITEKEAINIENKLIDPLVTKINGNSELYGWKIVTEHLRTIYQHGLCAYLSKIERQKEFEFPLLKGGVWIGSKPSDYNHYEERGRWFRTPSDVILGQYAGKFLHLTGAFHPSAKAHAVMGDSVYSILLRNDLLGIRKTLETPTTQTQDEQLESAIK
ncbi:hypothetical protein [Candidatus Nitrotoga sp. AM1P]|uniref:hypothetical protein n=1 Tax=Candidatus Nitrotoga sp. AM1P TaxID=2559597 RepID=UPI001563CADC|nr:hypothetical protein [Candidatus Nitrotoga sp. AM1P]